VTLLETRRINVNNTIGTIQGIIQGTIVPAMEYTGLDYIF